MGNDGEVTWLHTYRELECGHLWPVQRETPAECPYCIDTAESKLQYALDTVREHQGRAVS